MWTTGCRPTAAGYRCTTTRPRRVFTAEYKLAILAEGVHAFPHDAAGTIELKDAEVALHGRSYANRAVFEDLSLGYPRPIQDLLNIGAENRAHSSRPWHTEAVFEGFTDQARRVLTLAQEEARELHHPFIGPSTCFSDYFVSTTESWHRCSGR